MNRDKRGYYYRSERHGTKVHRQYIGKGEGAESMAMFEAIEREKREEAALLTKEEMTQLDDIDSQLKTLSEDVELIARAAMMVAGYHRHNRGEWRKRRGRNSNSG